MRKIVTLVLSAMMLINTITYAGAGEYIEYSITASALNVREYGSLDAPIIGTLYNGDTVSGDTLGNDWVNISYNGQSAYVSGEYLSTNTDESREYLGNFWITGYTSNPAENGGGTTNCFGEQLQPLVGQIVAVDPRVIPLNSKIYINGIGYKTVRDTGVRGKVIDVLVNSNSEAYALTGYYDVYIVR